MRDITHTLGRLVIVALLAPAIAQSDHHEFTIVMLPDTQTYTSLRPQIMEAQIDWITDPGNMEAENIIYLGHLGDLKDVGACTNLQIAWPSLANPSFEWDIVRDAFNQLDTAGIPYGVVPGNHDFDQQFGTFPNDSGGCPNFSRLRPLVGFNGQFVPSRIPAINLGGTRRAGNNEDNFVLASSNGFDFIFINLGYHEAANALGDTPEIDWAETLMLQYPNHIAIVTSHFLIDCNDSTTGGGGSANGSCSNTPDNEVAGYGANVYDRLGIYPNLFMMIGGHRFGEAYRRMRVDDPQTADVDESFGMNPVHVVLANYQHLRYSATDFETVTIPGPADGSSGFFKLMRFDVDSMTVDLDSVSPALAANAGIAGSGPIFPVLANGNRPNPVFSTRDIDPNIPTDLVDASGNPRLHTQSVSNLINISFDGYVSGGGGGGSLAWTIAGPGITSVADNADGSQSLSYSLNPAGLSTLRTWTVTSEPVPAAGDYTVNWSYSGLHAWFMVTARLTTSDGVTLVNAGPRNCCTTPSNGFNYSGTHTFANVAAGQTIGFTMGGQNFDRNNFLRGTLTLSQ